MPAPRFRYRPAIEKTIRAGKPLRLAIQKAVGLGAADARRRAPRDEGDYINGIVGLVVQTPFGAAGRIRATDWKSRWIEYGTGPPAPTPAFAPLRKAAISVGLKAHARGLRVAR